MGMILIAPLTLRVEGMSGELPPLWVGIIMEWQPTPEGRRHSFLDSIYFSPFPMPGRIITYRDRDQLMQSIDAWMEMNGYESR